MTIVYFYLEDVVGNTNWIGRIAAGEYCVSSDMSAHVTSDSTTSEPATWSDCDLPSHLRLHAYTHFD